MQSNTFQQISSSLSIYLSYTQSIFLLHILFLAALYKIFGLLVTVSLFLSSYDSLCLLSLSVCLSLFPPQYFHYHSLSIPYTHYLFHSHTLSLSLSLLHSLFLYLTYTLSLLAVVKYDTRYHLIQRIPFWK